MLVSAYLSGLISAHLSGLVSAYLSSLRRYIPACLLYPHCREQLILQGHRVSPLSAVTTCVPCSCKNFPSATPCILLIPIYSLRFGSSIVPSRKMSVILFSELEPLSAPKETANLLQNNYIILNLLINLLVSII